MIDLYFYPSPNGLKVAIMLEECGLPYRIVPVDILRGEQFAPAYLRINPNNKIPTIVDHEPARASVHDASAMRNDADIVADEGRRAAREPLVVFESGAVLVYLADKSGRFLSRDAERRYTALSWLFWQVGGLGPMAGQAHHFRAFAREAVPYGIKRYTDEVNRLYGVLERQLAGRNYIADGYSIADMACWPWVVSHERQGQRLEEFPGVQRWFETMRERPAVRRAYEIGHERMADAEAWQYLYGQTAATVRERERGQADRLSSP